MVKYLLILCLLIIGCKKPEQESGLYRCSTGKLALTKRMTFHVDVEFTNEQFAKIQEASKNWHVLTNGNVQFDLVKDYVKTWNETTSVDKNVILKFETSNFRDANNIVLGHTAFINNHIEIFLMSDLMDDKYIPWILAHEFGHALGMLHIKDNMSVFYNEYNFQSAWTVNDLKECQRLGYCC